MRFFTPSIVHDEEDSAFVIISLCFLCLTNLINVLNIVASFCGSERLAVCGQIVGRFLQNIWQPSAACRFYTLALRSSWPLSYIDESESLGNPASLMLYGLAPCLKLQHGMTRRRHHKNGIIREKVPGNVPRSLTIFRSVASAMGFPWSFSHMTCRAVVGLMARSNRRSRPPRRRWSFTWYYTRWKWKHTVENNVVLGFVRGHVRVFAEASVQARCCLEPMEGQEARAKSYSGILFMSGMNFPFTNG